jgi:hypothetical protein
MLVGILNGCLADFLGFDKLYILRGIITRSIDKETIIGSDNLSRRLKGSDYLTMLTDRSLGILLIYGW